MFNNSIFKGFCSGFKSVFRFGNMPVKFFNNIEISDYFCSVENDINKSYEELKKIKKNERN